MDNNNSNQDKGAMISLMGLWENVDKRGNKYLSGNIGNVRVMIFTNTFKQGEKEPDYRLFISKRNIEGQQQQSQGFGNAKQNNAPSSNNSEDDIPF